MAKLKIVVDFDVCVSNAVCEGIAPKVFHVDDDGFLQILQEYPSEDMIPAVRQAVAGCPTEAISLVEEAD